MTSSTDRVVRAITEDGAFRVIVAYSTSTVQGVITAQKARDRSAELLGDLLTGTILVRETMAPQLRVQGVVRAASGSGSLVADSHPDGSTRGLLKLNPGFDEVQLGGDALLQVMRTLPTGQIQQGIVELPDGNGLSGGFMRYMQGSEQVTCVTQVGTLLDGDRVVASGGYLVQLLPEAKQGPLMVMTARLEDFADIHDLLRSEKTSPQWLLEELLYAMPFATTGSSEVRFQCNCDQARVVAGLATLPRDQILWLLKDNEPLEINCDFCGKHYSVSPDDLRGLLKDN